MKLVGSLPQLCLKGQQVDEPYDLARMGKDASGRGVAAGNRSRAKAGLHALDCDGEIATWVEREPAGADAMRLRYQKRQVVDRQEQPAEHRQPQELERISRSA